MDVNNLNQLVSLIQRQRDEYQADRAEQSAPSSKADKKSPTRRSSPKSRLTPLELKAQIKNRLKSLQQDTELDEQTARRLFIESVLAWQFGNDILNDPKLHLLTSEIEQFYKEDERLDQGISKMIKQMVTG